MIKNTLLFLLSFSLIFSLSIQKTKIAQAAFPEPQRICNFNPNGAVTGNVTLANDCVIYEDVNGAANGNIVLNGNHVTLYRTMVWYPGYEIQITNGATIYVNSNAQIVQRIICLKDADGDFIPGTKALTVNPETGTQVTTALTQLDATVSGIQGVCPQDYKARENFTTLAYADLNDVASPSDSAMQSTTDNELLRLGFTIDGVTDVYAATGDIQINKDKNLILLPDGLGGKLGIGTTQPAYQLDIRNNQNSYTFMNISNSINDTLASGGLGINVGSINSSLSTYAPLYSSGVGSAGKTILTSDAPNGLRISYNIVNGADKIEFGHDDFGDRIVDMILKAGKVGIGTTTPTYTLMTNGSAANDITSAGSIYAYNSASTGNSGAIVNVGSNSSSGYIGAFNSTHTAAALADRFVMAANSNAAGLTMYAANAGQDIRFFTDAATSERMRINSNGNVGIGTIAPNSKLQVYETTTLGGTAGNSKLISSFGGSVSNAFMHNEWLYRTSGVAPVDWTKTRLHDGISVDTSFLTPGTDTRTWWERDPSNNIQSWGDYSSTYMTINGGNVGIGTTTPGANLHVTGGEIVQGGLWVSGTPADTVNGAPWYGIGRSNIYLGTGANAIQIGGWGGLLLQTGAGLMAISGFTGNVGIGTTIPATPLHVYSPTVNGRIATFDNAATSTQSYYDFKVAGTLRGSLRMDNAGNFIIDPTGTGATYLSWDSGTNGVVFGNGTGGLAGSVSGGGNLVMASGYFSGNLGVGVANPSAKLHVNGSVSYSIPATFTGASGASTWQSFAAQSIATSILANSSIVGGNIFSTSDKRLKNNISPFTDEFLNKFISEANPVNFTWKDSGNKDYGFIAQDFLRSGFGYLVSAVPNPEMKAEVIDGVLSPKGFNYIVKYDSIVPILTAIIKKQDAQIKSLNEKMIEIEKRLDAVSPK